MAARYGTGFSEVRSATKICSTAAESSFTFSRVFVLSPEPRFRSHSAAISLALCLSTSSSNSFPSNPPPPRCSPLAVDPRPSSASGQSASGVSGGDWLFLGELVPSQPSSSSLRGLSLSLGAVLGERCRYREVSRAEDFDLMAV